MDSISASWLLGPGFDRELRSVCVSVHELWNLRVLSCHVMSCHVSWQTGQDK